jgi:hypothetical protein
MAGIFKSYKAIEYVVLASCEPISYLRIQSHVAMQAYRKATSWHLHGTAQKVRQSTSLLQIVALKCAR